MTLHTIRLHNFGHIARTAPVVFETLLGIHLGEAGHECHVVDVAGVVNQFEKRLVFVSPEVLADGGSYAAQVVSRVRLRGGISEYRLTGGPPLRSQTLTIDNFSAKSVPFTHAAKSTGSS